MDSMGGWNLHFNVKNFIFTPDRAGAGDVDNTGHAHLYVDGVKVARVYGPWFHLSLPKGDHKVKVDLTTNSHKSYYYNEQPIMDEVELKEDRESSVHVH